MPTFRQAWFRRTTRRLDSDPNILDYTPSEFVELPPERTIAVESAWRGHERVIPSILERFDIGRDTCLEFGVEFGFSTVALSAYFAHVTGVDTFAGDVHTAHQGDHYAETRTSLAAFDNIELVQSSYQDWIQRDFGSYDLVHVDIVHTYEDTFRCGLWSSEHARCVLFHDTESFPAVREAVLDVATATNRRFYNYRPHYGLGIVV